MTWMLTAVLVVYFICQTTAKTPVVANSGLTAKGIHGESTLLKPKDILSQTHEVKFKTWSKGHIGCLVVDMVFDRACGQSGIRTRRASSRHRIRLLDIFGHLPQLKTLLQKYSVVTLNTQLKDQGEESESNKEASQSNLCENLTKLRMRHCHSDDVNSFGKASTKFDKAEKYSANLMKPRKIKRRVRRRNPPPPTPGPSLQELLALLEANRGNSGFGGLPRWRRSVNSLD